MTRRRGNPEERLHRECVNYLRLVLPADALVHHSPNEGARGGRAGAIDGQRRKALGMTPGWPDLEVIAGGRFLALEIKAAGGRLSKEQAAIRDQFAAQGIAYAVVRSVDDVAEVLADLGIKTRGKIS